mgnify:CR=1 FL=1
MSNRAIARRYASALFAEASSTDTVDRVDEDVELVSRTLSDSRDLKMLFTSPIVSTAKKEAVIRRLFDSHVSELALSFLVRRYPCFLPLIAPRTAGNRRSNGAPGLRYH